MVSRATTQTGTPTTALSVRADEAARMLGVSTRTLERWAKAGIVPSAKVENTRLFRVATLERWLDERERAGGGEEGGGR